MKTKIKMQSAMEYLVMLAIASIIIVAAIGMATKLKGAVSIDTASQIASALKNLSA